MSDDMIHPDAVPEIIEKIKTALAAKGVRMHIGSCGCCKSPWVALEIDGEVIVGDLSVDTEHGAVPLFGSYVDMSDGGGGNDE